MTHQKTEYLSGCVNLLSSLIALRIFHIGSKALCNQRNSALDLLSVTSCHWSLVCTEARCQAPGVLFSHLYLEMFHSSLIDCKKCTSKNFINCTDKLFHKTFNFQAGILHPFLLSPQICGFSFKKYGKRVNPLYVFTQNNPYKV